MHLTTQEANEILSRGFPEPDDLKRFPYGELLHRLWMREDIDAKQYREHAPKVLDSMNILLSKEPGAIMGDRMDEPGEKILRKTQLEVEGLFGVFDANARALFRLAALYHDIGKYIIKERHPTVGWYTMEYSNPEQKDPLRTLVGEREDYLQLLMLMIRDHDQFGVLSTGEASLPILLKAASSLGNIPEEQKRIISAIMWLNLADMAGTPGLELNREDIVKVVGDWKWFLNALDACAADKKPLDDYVIQEAGSQDLVEQRICRILLESSRYWPRRLAELRGPNEHELAVRRYVRNQLRTVYDTKNPRREFAYQFSLVCKLDYGLRFFAKLVEYCEGPPEPGEKRSLPVWANTRVETEQLIYAMFAILRRITSTYLAMVRSDNGPGNLIGVELKDLTPNNAPEKTGRIIELLLKSHYPGLSWMMSDCPAWYF